MQTVAIRSVAPATPTIRWLKPAPLWGSADTDRTTPYLAEFASDQFLPDFLAMMSGQTSLSLHPPRDEATLGLFKLYQPLHQRYYLVTGSLVCRQFGLPDRTVVRKNHEQTSFVLRRSINNHEYGWVNDGPNKGWQLLVDERNRPVAVRQDEERLPLHQVKACMPAQPGNKPCEQRMVYYGYIPVSSREKYLAAVPPIDVATRIQQAVIDGVVGDPRLDDVSTRVLEPWLEFYIPPPGGQITPEAQHAQISLYLILDLADFLQANLPSVFDALGTDGSSLKVKPQHDARYQLLEELGTIIITQTDTDSKNVSLAFAMNELKSYLSLVHGEGLEPPSSYNLYAATGINFRTDLEKGGQLYTDLKNALDEEKIDNVNWLNVPGEVAGMIKDEPDGGDSYYLRLVYEHAPCAPVVSEPSQPFTFAKVFDPDAPARQIRIELPSIDFRDLRKFKHGVGMQMSPQLSRVLGRVHPGMLQGQGLLPTEAGAVGLAVICTFSLPIITLVALIVMFLFLLLFNIIFWWLPFFMICFPIPRRK